MTLVFCAGIATHILTNALISIGILRISTSSCSFGSLVRRVISNCLLLLLLLPLIWPLFAASAAEANLPACCRRQGKHHCAMSAGLAGSADPGGVWFTAAQEKCPCYPTSSAMTHLNFFTSAPDTTVFSNVRGLQTCLAHAEACYRISFDRSRQKRGPPNQSLFPL